MSEYIRLFKENEFDEKLKDDFFKKLLLSKLENGFKTPYMYVYYIKEI